jgi:hypothetical protein
MVLFRGRIVLRDSAADLRRNSDRLHRAYLGANGHQPRPDDLTNHTKEPM